MGFENFILKMMWGGHVELGADVQSSADFADSWALGAIFVLWCLFHVHFISNCIVVVRTVDHELDKYTLVTVASTNRRKHHDLNKQASNFRDADHALTTHERTTRAPSATPAKLQ